MWKVVQKSFNFPFLTYFCNFFSFFFFNFRQFLNHFAISGCNLLEVESDCLFLLDCLWADSGMGYILLRNILFLSPVFLFQSLSLSLFDCRCNAGGEILALVFSFLVFLISWTCEFNPWSFLLFSDCMFVFDDLISLLFFFGFDFSQFTWTVHRKMVQSRVEEFFINFSAHGINVTGNSHL